MICCLHHKRLRETEFTTRWFYYISFTSSFLFFNSLQFTSGQGFCKLWLYQGPRRHLNTSTGVESSVDRLVLIRQQKAPDP